MFLAMVGTPFESDTLTTALRFADEALRQGHRVTVWTCGYSTALTAAALGERRPRNALAWDRSYPSTAAVVRRLLGAGGGRLTWLVCRYCAQERGTAAQVEGVRVVPPHRFLELLLAADAALVLGVK